MASQRDLTSEPAVPVATRFFAAWSEINTRIAQRQHVITIYTSLAFAAIGVALYSQGQGAQSATSVGYGWRIVYAVPFASLVFYLLLRMHEQMIHNLHQYLAFCDALDDKLRLPSYHQPTSPWYQPASRARRLQDAVAVILIVGLNLLAAVACAPAYRTLSPFEQGFQWLLLIAVFVLSGLVYRIRYLRHPTQLHPKVSDDDHAA